MNALERRNEHQRIDRERNLQRLFSERATKEEWSNLKIRSVYGTEMEYEINSRVFDESILSKLATWALN